MEGYNNSELNAVTADYSRRSRMGPGKTCLRCQRLVSSSSAESCIAKKPGPSFQEGNSTI